MKIVELRVNNVSVPKSYVTSNGTPIQGFAIVDLQPGDKLSVHIIDENGEEVKTYKDESKILVTQLRMN